MTRNSDMDEAVNSRSYNSMAFNGEAGDTDERAMVSPAMFSCPTVEGRDDDVVVAPPRPPFLVAAAVEQALSDRAPSLTRAGDAAAGCGQEDDSWQSQQQTWQRREKNEEEKMQKDHELHRRKQVLHAAAPDQQQQQTCQGQQQVEGEDVYRQQQMDMLSAEAAEELTGSTSGLARLESLTHLSSGEFRMWRAFLLPTAATALSIPMLILVGSAPVLCMLLYITCMHNVITAMFTMHWVCMIAVPLLYVKFVERSFDYYWHVWTVQSYRFATQWKPGLLLACFSAIFFYVTYRGLQYWGGPWFAAVLDTARTNALGAGLDLPFVSLVAAGCYFCICNPFIEEWFWRVFLYREFGGAVFFITENRGGMFVLRDTPHHPFSGLWTRTNITTQDTAPAVSVFPATSSSSPELRRDSRSDGRDAGRIFSSQSGSSKEGLWAASAAADAFNYQELLFERSEGVVVATASEKERRRHHAAGCPAGETSYTSTTSTDGVCSGFSVVSPSITTSNQTTSRSFSGPGSASTPAAPAATMEAAAQDMAPAAVSFSSRGKQTPNTPLLSTRSFRIRPTARTDALLVQSSAAAFGDRAETEGDDVNELAVSCPAASPLAAAGAPSSSSPHGLSLISSFSRDPQSAVAVTASGDAGSLAFSDGALEFLRGDGTYFERIPTTRGPTSSRKGGEEGMHSSPRIHSPPAPDAPIMTHVGRGVLQVDLRLSLLGQIVLSLFYASYHTVVFAALTGTVGGCIALPCVAILGMVLIRLRNSCVFGLLGGVLMHVGVDLGVVSVLGAVLQVFP